LDCHNSWFARRIRPLSWGIDSLRERSLAICSKEIINKQAETTRYSIRALRYWWLRCALLDEISKKEAVTVADIGSSSGHFKQFFGEMASVKWMAFDRKIDQQHLRGLGYEECVECDLDETLPCPSDSVDVVVFSHVVEHLLRPECAISEIARILRPGGVLLAGSPVLPFPFSRIREWQHRRRYRKGKVEHGGHINSMDSSRWKSLTRSANLHPEMIHGTYFLRWSGNPLENFKWWIRINQLWGIIFPSWAGEIYLAARKTRELQTHSSQESASKAVDSTVARVTRPISPP